MPSLTAKPATTNPSTITVDGVRYSEPVGKSIELKGGKITKTPLSRGPEAEVIRFDGPARDLPAWRQKLGPNDMLVAGTFDVPEGTDVVYNDVVNGKSVAASNEYLSFRPGGGVMIIDVDTKSEDEVEKLYPVAPESFDTVSVAIDTVHELLGSEPYTLGCYGTSGNIFDASGNPLTGRGSIRLYIAVSDATRIPHLLDLLHKQAWLSGYGWAFMSKGGSFQERSIVDRALARPHQPDFAAPMLEDGLTQDRGWEDREGPLLDPAAVPELTEDEEHRYRQLVQEARAALEPAHQRVRERKIRERIADGMNRDDAEQVVDRVFEDQILPLDHPVTFKDGEAITVRELLRNGADYQERDCLDPLEPEYDGGRAVARFYWHGADGVINSFAHGKTKFSLDFDSYIDEGVAELVAAVANNPQALPELPVPANDDAFQGDVEAASEDELVERLMEGRQLLATAPVVAERLASSRNPETNAPLSLEEQLAALLSLVGGSNAKAPSHPEHDAWLRVSELDYLAGLVKAANPAGDLPIDFMTELPPPSIEDRMIPEAVREFVSRSADIIGAQPEAMFWATMSAIVAVLDPNIKIQPHSKDEDWLEPSILWLMLIGPPSAKKTPVRTRALKPVQALEKELQADNERRMKGYEIDLGIYKRQLAEYQKAAAKGREAEQPKEPSPPIIRRLLVNDATTEKLQDILKHSSQGTTSDQDELSGWFGSHDAYNGNNAGAKDRAFYLQAYNGGSYSVDRIGRGSSTIDNLAIKVTGAIQPSALRNVTKRLPTDGLMQRFYPVALPEVGADMGRDAAVPKAVARHYEKLIESLVKLDTVDMAGGDVRAPIQVPREVSALVNDTLKPIMELQSSTLIPVAMQNHLGKWQGGVYRWILLYHLIGCVDAGTDPFNTPVSVETAQSVLAIHQDFFLAQLWVLYESTMSEDSVTHHARWIGGHILSKGVKVLTNRDIQQHYKPWRTMEPRQRAAVIQFLEDHDWIKPANGEPPFSAPTKWRVHPKLHEMLSERAEKERAHRAANMELLNRRVRGRR